MQKHFCAGFAGNGSSRFLVRWAASTSKPLSRAPGAFDFRRLRASEVRGSQANGRLHTPDFFSLHIGIVLTPFKQRCARKTGHSPHCSTSSRVGWFAPDGEESTGATAVLSLRIADGRKRPAVCSQWKGQWGAEGPE